MKYRNLHQRVACALTWLTAISISIAAVELAVADTGDLDPAFAELGRLGPVNELKGSVWAVEPLEGGSTFIGGGDRDVRIIRDSWDNPRFVRYEVSVSSFLRQLGDDGSINPAYLEAAVEDFATTAVLRQPDGKAIATGDRLTISDSSIYQRLTTRPLVVRYLEDGQLDPGFGNGGIFEWAEGQEGAVYGLNSLALDPDGRILVAGRSDVLVNDELTTVVAVIRLLANGTLDETFGTNGVYLGSITGSAIQLVRMANGSYHLATRDQGSCTIVGLTADGAPDSGFGSSGAVLVETSAGDAVGCNALEPLESGQLMVAGYGGGHGFLARLLANGAPDPAFAGDSTIANTLTDVTSIVATTGGKLLIGGTSSEGTLVLRLQENGTLDSTFGVGGRTLLDFDSESGSAAIVHVMAVREDGSVIAAGRDAWSDRAFVARLLGDNGGDSPGVVGFHGLDPIVQEAGGQAIVHVRRTGGSDGIVTVAYRTVADQNATSDDFTAASGRLQWEDGDSADKQIIVEIAQDGGEVEEHESFRIVLEDAQGGVGFGTRGATVTIEPDGAPAGQIEIDDADYGLAGEDGIGQIWLFRNYYYDGAVCVTVTPRSGTAIAGEDFVADPSTVCWGDQDSEAKLAEIPFVDDDEQEGDESFYVELSSPTGGAIIGLHRSATITIAANDEVVVTPPPPPPPPPSGGGGSTGVGESLLALLALLVRGRRKAQAMRDAGSALALPRARIWHLRVLLRGTRKLFGRYQVRIMSSAAPAGISGSHSYLLAEDSMNMFHVRRPASNVSRCSNRSMAFFAMLFSLAFAAPALAQTYTAIDVPGYPYTHAFGINDFGSIVGDCDFADGYVSAYVLRRGNFTIIDAPGAVATTAWDINNLGAIVGDYYGEDYLFHGFLYVDGKLTTIDFPGAVHTSAQGIDDFGRIVGIYIDDTDTWRGFILAGDRFRVIEAPNSEFTTAVGITGPDIVGDMEVNGVSSGYVLRKGRFTPITYPGADFTTANRINYSAEIVGTWSEDANSDVGHAYLLTRRGFTSFDFPHATLTTGRDINDQGHIVGSYRDEAGYVHGYLRVPRHAGH